MSIRKPPASLRLGENVRTHGAPELASFMIEFRRKTVMRGILVLAVLSVKSSYSRNLEIALQREDDVPDTLQWWLGRDACWRILTYALDHDIHTYFVGNSA